MKENNIIYGLLCPLTSQIRYVGKSTTGLVRPNRHRNTYSLRAKTHKNHWIKDLLSKGKDYSVQVLEIVNSPEELDEKEIYWINHYNNLGHKLTNGTNGGVGSTGRKLSEETKAKIAEKRRLFIEVNGISPTLLKFNQDRRITSEIAGVPHRKCSECLVVLPASSFHKNKTTGDGLNYVCKECFYVLRKARTDKKKLSPEAFQVSYANRQKSMSAGLKTHYKANPEATKVISVRMSKPVQGTNPITGEILNFPSALEAKKAGFNNTNLGQAIRSGKLYKGFRWIFKN